MWAAFNLGNYIQVVPQAIFLLPCGQEIILKNILKIIGPSAKNLYLISTR